MDQEAQGWACQWWPGARWDVATELGSFGHRSASPWWLYQICGDYKCWWLALQIWAASRCSGWIAWQQLCGRVREVSQEIQAKLCDPNCHGALRTSHWSVPGLGKCHNFDGVSESEGRKLNLFTKTKPVAWQMNFQKRPPSTAIQQQGTVSVLEPCGISLWTLGTPSSMFHRWRNSTMPPGFIVWLLRRSRKFWFANFILYMLYRTPSDI